MAKVWTRRNAAMIGAVAVMGLATAGATLRAGDELPAAVNVTQERVAVAGYDLVALWNGDEIEGDAAHSAAYKGVEYHFASAANADRFRTDPAMFMPEFGGYCAYGVRMGQKLPIDITAHEIVDGRLFLFLDRATHLTWQQDQRANVQVADQLWPEVAGT